jgi:hypothetical protein
MRLVESEAAQWPGNVEPRDPADALVKAAKTADQLAQRLKPLLDEQRALDTSRLMVWAMAGQGWSAFQGRD